MIDIHSHILFGVDDGPKDIEGSLSFLQEEISKGVNCVILTPHFKSNLMKYWPNSAGNFEKLKNTVKENQLNIEIYMGSEIFFDSDFYNILDKKEFCTLADSDYMLMEFNLNENAKNISEMCYEVRLRGYRPIIAHIERFESLYDEDQVFLELMREGVLFQVNSSTIVGDLSKKTKKFIDFLIKHRLISFIASDMHNLTTRNTLMDEAYAKILKVTNKEYADKIFSENQQKVINNDKIFLDIDKDFSEDKKKGFLSKLFKNS